MSAHKGSSGALSASAPSPEGTWQLALQGMSCASCARSIEQALAQVQGVSHGSVNFASEQATVKGDPRLVDPQALIRAVERVGVSGAPYPGGLAAGRSVGSRADRPTGRRTGIEAEGGDGGGHQHGAGDRIPADDAGDGHPGLSHWLHNPGLQLLLTAPVQFWVGKHFYRGAWAAWQRRSADMNTLVALGTSAAFFYSVFPTVFPRLFSPARTAPDVYYEVSAVVTTLILVGKWMEQRAKGQTSEAIRKLIGLQPKTARVIRQGVEQDVPIREVQVGDWIRVRPGEKVPWMG
jgi:Cu+-exporting ATPase